MLLSIILDKLDFCIYKLSFMSIYFVLKSESKFVNNF